MPSPLTSHLAEPISRQTQVFVLGGDCASLGCALLDAVDPRGMASTRLKAGILSPEGGKSGRMWVWALGAGETFLALMHPPVSEGFGNLGS